MITFFACFFVVGIVMLISFLLLYASIRITCINIRNGAKMELNNPVSYTHLYEGRIVQARVIAVAEKVVRVEVFGVETSILARDLAWDWIQ